MYLRGHTFIQTTLIPTHPGMHANAYNVTTTNLLIIHVSDTAGALCVVLIPSYTVIVLFTRTYSAAPLATLSRSRFPMLAFHRALSTSHHALVSLALVQALMPPRAHLWLSLSPHYFSRPSQI